MLGLPFCAVCRRQIVATLSPHLPPKTIFKEIKDAKHEKIEKHEKLEKPEKLEIKDHKHEKLEKPEIKDHKHEKNEKVEKLEKLEKLEKVEKIEKPELKDHKPEKFEVEGKRLEPERSPVEIPKLKDAEVQPWQGLGDIATRVAQLEATIARMAHFITPEMRPDLSKGALLGEPDVGPEVAARPTSRPAKRSRRKRRS